MTDDNPTRRRSKLLVPVLAGALAAAVALPASAALAGGGDSGGAGGSGGSAPTFEQVQQQPDRERPDGHDCPERGQGGGQTSTPEV
jgi:hypothetical protein